jgi:hypothetical protein
MIYRTSRELPRSLRGYAIWLQVLDQGAWYEVCSLRPADARAVLRWLDRHPLRTNLRVIATTV